MSVDLSSAKAPSLEIEKTCLRLLSMREHSQQELRQKLLLKGFSDQAITPVLADMIAKGWQSDERFADAYMRYRTEKGFGLERIRHELRQRGISSELVDALLMANPDEYTVNIQETYLKKYDENREISRAEWLKRSRFLLQRGFSSGNINALFKHLQLKLT